MAAAARPKKRLESERRCPPLPEEIMEDILSRLPVKSLNRFRCVSRAWAGAIASPALQSLHLERSLSGGGRRLFLNPSWQFPFYAWSPGSPAAAVETIMDNRRLPPGPMFPITKSCHGLVLLRCLDYDYDIHYVWNPSAGGELLPLPDMVARHGQRANAVYGMGYCSMTKRYKVVRMYNLHPQGNSFDTACETFTLDESTHWRPAATKPPASRLQVNRRQGAVLCNGNLHFIQNHGVGALTSFNVSDETFSTMLLPYELGANSSGFMLTELDGCLCVYHAEDPPNLDQPYQIWLLRDYEAEKWEQVCCIDWRSMGLTERLLLKSSWIAPLDMYDDNNTCAQKKKIMFGTSTCKVFVVNPDIGIPEILFSPNDTIIGECRDDGGPFPAMGLFEETIMSAGRSNEEILFTSPSTQSWAKVLTYLPARTVGRLNQVCRDWRAMIKSNRFVDAHLHRANLNTTALRIMFTDGKPYRFKALEDFIDTSQIPPLVNEGSRVVCSKPCHGLNAGSFRKCDFICNPLTKHYKVILLCNGKGVKTTNLYSGHRVNPLDNSLFAGRLGLGYEPNLRTHVLVSLAYKEERNLATMSYRLECKVQLINRGDWVEIEPPPRPVADAPPAYTSGKLYWMVDPEFGFGLVGCEMVMLDLITLEFDVLEGPPCSHSCGRISIIELEGEVCLASSRRSANTIEIWNMDAIGMWSVRHCIELTRYLLKFSPEEATPLAINPRDGRILLSTGKALGYYDTKTAELETIYSLGAHIRGKKFVPILVMDSLVNPCDVMLYNRLSFHGVFDLRDRF